MVAWLQMTVALACMGIAPLLFETAHATSGDQAADNHTPIYLDVEGGVSLSFDEASRTMTADTFSDGAERTPEGNLVSERQSFGYGDCSDAVLICRDFEEFVLAVPHPREKMGKWDWNGWKFRTTTCFLMSKGACVRFAAKFNNDELHREGGFVFSYSGGVELFYYTNTKLRDPRHIYAKKSSIGLLQELRP